MGRSPPHELAPTPAWRRQHSFSVKLSALYSSVSLASPTPLLLQISSRVSSASGAPSNPVRPPLSARLPLHLIDRERVGAWQRHEVGRKPAMDVWLQAGGGGGGGGGAESAAARPRCNPFAGLPDELLVEVLSRVPTKTRVVPLAGGTVYISRSSVERVSRRWRRLALQCLPASLTIDLTGQEQAWDMQLVAEAFEGLLPHIAARRVAECSIQADAAAVPPTLPAALAPAVFPTVCKLSLGGDCLLHFTSFLSLCARLGELRLRGQQIDAAGREQAAMLSTHLRALPAKLDKLRLEVHETPSELMDTVAHHLQPSVLSLLACAPSQSMWLPQLQRCAVQFHTNDQLELLEAGLEHVAGLRALHVSDERPLPVRIAEPPELLALEDLPQLRSLECTSSLPNSAMRCRHLTALRCTNANLPLSEDLSCTGLRQLRLRSCTLPDDAFPAALCTLSQLSNLELFCCKLSRLPSAFSNLSSLCELAITDACLDSQSMAAVAPLRCLTNLALSDCNLASLPHGPYLAGLQSLKLSGPLNNLGSPLPFEATAARGLRRLTITCPASWREGMECWEDLEWKLHCFRELESLHLEAWTHVGPPGPYGYWRHFPPTLAEALAELTELCRSTSPRCDVRHRVLKHREPEDDILWELEELPFHVRHYDSDGDDVA